jgi:membrane-associated progesterone receptor component
MPSLGQLALYGLTLSLPLILYYRLTAKPAPAPQGNKDEKKEKEKKSATIMQPERTDLEPPKDDPYTQEQLKAYDGTDKDKPIYLAIKGEV